MRILVFGDSITQGFHDEEMGGWCNRLVVETMRRDVESDYSYNRSVINLGISGDTSADVRKRIRTESEARLLKYSSDGSDVLMLAIGVNDSQYDMSTGEQKIMVEATIKNIQTCIAETTHLYDTIVLVGLAPVFDARIQPMAWKKTHGYANTIIDQYNEHLKVFAETHDYHFINVSDVYDDVDACLPDGIHPNAHGHQRIYQHIKAELEKAGIL